MGRQVMGLKAFMKDTHKELSCPLPAMWKYKEKSAVYNMEKCLHHKPAMRAPWSQTFSLQKYEKEISIFHKSSSQYTLLS